MTKSTSTTPRCLTPLPVDFSPSPTHVVTNSKNAQAVDHAGNQWLRSLIKSNLQDYADGSTCRRHAIVSSIIHTIQQEKGWFICRKRGRWFAVDHTVAREKVARLFKSKLQKQKQAASSEECSSVPPLEQLTDVEASSRQQDVDDERSTSAVNDEMMDGSGNSRSTTTDSSTTSTSTTSSKRRRSIHAQDVNVPAKSVHLEQLESLFQLLMGDPTNPDILSEILTILTKHPQYCLHPFSAYSPTAATAIPSNAFLGSTKKPRKAKAIPLKLFLILNTDLPKIQALCHINTEALLYNQDSCPIPIHLAMELKTNPDKVLFLADACTQAMDRVNEFFCTPVKVALASHYYPNHVVQSLIQLCPHALNSSWGLQGGSALAAALHRNLGANVVKLLIQQQIMNANDNNDDTKELHLGTCNYPQLRACDGSVIYIPLILNEAYARELVQLLPRITTLHLECAGWTPEGQELFLKHLQANTSITEIRKLTLSFQDLESHMLQGWCNGRLQRLHLSRCERDTTQDNTSLLHNELVLALAHRCLLEELEIDARLPGGEAAKGEDVNLGACLPTLLRNAKALRSLTLRGIKCNNMPKVCGVLQDNTVLQTLVSIPAQPPSTSELDSYRQLFSNLLNHHNTALQQIELTTLCCYKCGPSAAAQRESQRLLLQSIDYNLRVNAYLRQFAQNPTPTEFLGLLAAFPHDNAYGLLRQLPAVWCRGIDLTSSEGEDFKHNRTFHPKDRMVSHRHRWQV